jgi:hypothetical protein
VRRVVHEIRNHLAIAIANVEAFRDGMLEPSPQRLAAVLQALGEVDVLLRELTTARDGIANEVAGDDGTTTLP